jgi:hypothetical protein
MKWLAIFGFTVDFRKPAFQYFLRDHSLILTLLHKACYNGEEGVALSGTGLPAVLVKRQNPSPASANNQIEPNIK